MDMNTVKGIIFDYGGTIDTNGIHWAEVIWEQYIAAGVTIEKQLFRDAYVYAERALAKSPIIEPTDTFHRLLTKKIAIHAEFLKGKITSAQQDIIVEGCYRKVLDTLETTCGIVKKLSERYPMVLVTNFYGNMNVVLKEFGLKEYFPIIIESSVVGIRKPDPALFALGVEALGLKAGDVVVIGDSYRKDIYPSHTLGCKTVWLKGACWEEETPSPDALPHSIIGSIEELLNIMGGI